MLRPEMCILGEGKRVLSHTIAGGGVLRKAPSISWVFIQPGGRVSEMESQKKKILLGEI